MQTLRVSAPGRICLFGEHQDYLGLPVITAAINLRIEISGRQIPGRKISIHLPDIHSEENFFIPPEDEELRYDKERDYFKSAFNLLRRQGFSLKNACECAVRGNIPINSGTSSSSALAVAWTKFLIELNNVPEEEKPSARQIAHLAYLAEVEEFGEPGGMMDHFASAVGGVLFQQFLTDVQLTHLKQRLGTFVLGDSGQPKDTMKILKRVKFGVLEAVKKIKQIHPEFELSTSDIQTVGAYRSVLSEAHVEVLEGALLNRDITREAKKMFDATEFNHRDFGKLLNDHQEILDKKLGISTPKINLMLRKALDAGAYGGKINGSGGGGCMFVYAPEQPERVAEAIRRAGGKTYIVRVDRGLVVSN